MNNREWTTAFGLSFIPLVLWIFFIVYNFDVGSPAFPWPVFLPPTLLYIGFQFCLALLAFGEQIGKMTRKLYLAAGVLGEKIRKWF
jgi:uncharacterized RDD family membrane protein YckC